ncbi:hypothetical protein [Streptomyces spectabilis]|uniref:Uncharacterized protein n=1 Tax=Streptomyces spectabilis TaxID=68270 RepID=A0A7W8F019_STRST|nr:hypothetical protein [Streptomyces spectabilis]MBB5109993.1 hypothetical protein [Streptomyces spectabilis]
MVWASLPKGLERLLEPVAMVWGRIERMGARQVLIGAVQRHLGEIRGWCDSDEAAERLLRARLQRRLADQGSAHITNPVGWLMSRAASPVCVSGFPLR